MFKNLPNLRGDGESVPMEPWQLNEIRKCVNDPVYFANNYVKITTKDHGIQLFKTWEFQADLISTMKNNRFVISRFPRQCGKSTTTRAFLLWQAIFTKDISIAILANKLALSKEQLQQLKESYAMLPYWMQPGLVEWNKQKVRFSNRTSVFCAATSPDGIRGLAVNILYIDEFAFIPNYLADEFISSIFPTISSGETTKIFVTSCVTRDTMVFTDKGIRTVGEFVNDEIAYGGYEIPEYRVMGFGDSVNTGSIMHNDGLRKTKIIKTKYSELECSLPHRLWVSRDGNVDWVKASELRVGDYVPVKYGMNLWGHDAVGVYTITPNIAYIIGLYIRLGELPQCYQSESEFILNLFAYLGIDTTSPLGVIPSRLMQLTKECTMAMIQGIYDTTRDKTPSYIEINSYMIIKQIRMILLNMGILTTLSSDGDIYRLSLDHIKSNSEAIIWDCITSIRDSENYVYDFSLNDVDGDKWCHSVAYNGIIGHQTPKSLNHFYTLWEGAVKGPNHDKWNGFVAKEIPWNAVPGRTDQWAKEQIAKIGQIRFNQEYLCEFIGSVSTLIDNNFLKSMRPVESMQLPGLPECVNIWGLPLPIAMLEQKNWEYVACIDASYGVRADSSVLKIYLVKSNITMHLVAQISTNEMEIEEFCALANDLLKYYHSPNLIIEMNGPGAAAMAYFHGKVEYDNLLHFDPKGRMMGLWAGDKLKNAAVILLKSYVQRKFVKDYDADTIAELYSFGKVTKEKWGGMGGNHDDHVMCMMWCIYYVNSPLYFGNIVEVNVAGKNQLEGVFISDEQQTDEDNTINQLKDPDFHNKELADAAEYNPYDIDGEDIEDDIGEEDDIDFNDENEPYIGGFRM